MQTNVKNLNEENFKINFPCDTMAEIFRKGLSFMQLRIIFEMGVNCLCNYASCIKFHTYRNELSLVGGSVKFAVF